MDKTIEQWFYEFDEHLKNDQAPSRYFLKLLENKTFPAEKPFDMLFKLKYVKQNPKHHPEGNVFKHTMLVVDNAAKLKEKSSQPDVFVWSALLHDVGKIPATKLRKGRLTAYDHDKFGADMSYDFLKKCGCDEQFCSRVSKMVRWHMQAMFVAKDMPYADIDSMAEDVDIDEIALLALCDRLGRGQTEAKEIKKEQDYINLFIEKSKNHINNKG